MTDQRSIAPKALGTLGDCGDPTLGSPPSLGNEFYASFQPPAPDYPDHRENARRDRLGESRPDLEPMTHVCARDAGCSPQLQCGEVRDVPAMISPQLPRQSWRVRARNPSSRVARAMTRGRGVSLGWVHIGPNN